MKSYSSSSNLLLISIFIFTSIISQVSGINWAEGKNGTFTSTKSWVGEVVPTTETADITAVGDYFVFVTASGTFAGKINLGGVAGSNPTLLISSGVTFQIDGELVLNSGSVTVQYGATLIINGFRITSNSALAIYLDYMGELRVNSLSVSSGWVTINGYGILDISNANVNMNPGNLLLTTSSTVKIGNNTKFSPFSAIRLAGPLNVLSSITTNTLFEFGYASTITVEPPFILTLNNNVLIDPTTGNTVIVNGNVRCQSNLTINTGTITLQTGDMRVGNNLILNENTQFISDIDASSLSFGSMANIMPSSTVTVFANIKAEGSLTLLPPANQVLYVSGRLTMNSGLLSVKGSVVIAGELNMLGSSSVVIPAAGSNKLTFNPDAVLTLGSSNVNQISGAGYLILMQGSSLTVNSNCVIPNPVVLQSTVNVKSGVAVTFSGTLSMNNGTSFVSTGGDQGFVYLKSTVDMSNDGEVTAEHKLNINNVNVVLSYGAVVYFPTGVLNIQTGGNLIVNGTLYTTFGTPILIEGDGTLTVAANGIYWVTAPVTVAANFVNMGQVKLNSGHLILASGGNCVGTVSNYGTLEIRGTWNLGSCRPLGNGTVYYNAPMATNQIFPAGNYSFGVLRIGGSSVLSTEVHSDYGFYMKANITLEKTASFIINSNSILKGSLIMNDQSTLTLKSATVLKITDSLFTSQSNLMLEADASSSLNSNIVATGVMTLAGKLFVNVNGANVLNEINVISYFGKVGAFDSVVVNTASSLFYTMRYDAKKAFAVNTKAVTTGLTTNMVPVPASSSTSSTSEDSFTTTSTSSESPVPPTPSTGDSTSTPVPTPETPIPSAMTSSAVPISADVESSNSGVAVVSSFALIIVSMLLIAM